MARWKKLIPIDGLRNEELKSVVVDGEMITVAAYNGRVYALPLRCGHMGAPLYRGKLEKNQIVCPMHGAVYNIEDGSLISGPIMGSLPGFEKLPQESQSYMIQMGQLMQEIETKPIKPYETKVEDGTVFVKI